MSSRKSNEEMKKRLQASKDTFDSRGFAGSFKMDHISGDTNIRNVSVDDLVEAPEDWNFYKPLSESKMQELVESIESNGLLHPIVVWEQPDGKYMILAGHNRARAYRMLEEAKGDGSYRKISALIKEKGEIDEDDAKEIIIDTNWVQRSLSAIEKSKSIIEKYAVLEKKKKSGAGRVRNVIAEEYEITGRLVDEYRRLGSLAEELQNMVSDGSLSMTSAAKLALFDVDTQLWMIENYRGKLSRKYTKQLKTGMDREAIRAIFESEGEAETSSVSITLAKDISERYKGLETGQRLEIAKALEELISKL
ncbi:nucleoid occlusion protein [Andreesenia angusta]|uniref:Nucleoid occlusion protein n=1 Tax=Andreesenia angusta TaxID=39480 RepID=A0A1S1V3J4_9FIRM|nr:ParB N-terminal domain-containing protein [Andreesenia angusta]OHW61276.1 nucleoid occlusion protein [Andreesenia angusta]